VIKNKSGQKGFASIIFLVVFVVIVAFGAYYFGLRSRNGVTDSVDEKSEFATSTPIVPNEDSGATGNWKIYTNTGQRFSIKYPSDLYSFKTERLQSGETYVVLEPTNAFNYRTPQAVTYSLSIAAVNKTDLAPSLKSNPRSMFGTGPLLMYQSEELGSTAVKDTTLGGLKAYRVDGCCGGAVGVEADIQTIRDGVLYQIVVFPQQLNGDPDVNKKVYEDILATFQFLQ
jgi:hypothetical protein